MSGKVLIFGIGGFVGPYLAEEFLNAGYAVYGSDIRMPLKLPKGIFFTAADLMKEDDILRIVSEISPDMIVNLAAVSSVGMSWQIPQATIKVNVVGALNIMEAARRQKPMPKVMFIGSSEEYEVSEKPIKEDSALNANNPYGISKITQERFAALYRKQYGLEVYCVRAFNHTGIGQSDAFVLPSFCKQAAEIENAGMPGTIKVGNLAAKRDFSHVKDIVRAYRMIMENGNSAEVYNVGYGRAYALEELLNYIISLCSQKVLVEVDSAKFRPIDTPVICCDREKIKKELGWEPKYSVFDALKELFENYRSL